MHSSSNPPKKRTIHDRINDSHVRRVLSSVCRFWSLSIGDGNPVSNEYASEEVSQNDECTACGRRCDDYLCIAAQHANGGPFVRFDVASEVGDGVLGESDNSAPSFSLRIQRLVSLAYNEGKSR